MDSQGIELLSKQWRAKIKAGGGKSEWVLEKINPASEVCGKGDRAKELEPPPQSRLENSILSEPSGCNSDGPVKAAGEFDDDEDKHAENKNDHHSLGAPSLTSSSNPGISSKSQDASKRTTTESCNERRDQCQAMTFCTQRCLRGLLIGGLLDESCPNIETHRKGDNHHCLDPSSFRELMGKQLAESLIANCFSLDLKGYRGALFKVRLTSHGYTVAAKCTSSAHVSNLLHESVVYNQLDEIQGIHVPVCLGNIDLPGILRHNGVQYVHMMFLSWGGERIELHAELFKDLDVEGQAVETLQAIHELGVLHCDVSPRNILWSKELGHIMFIDFERSEIKASSKQPLIPASRKDQGKGQEEGGRSVEWKDRKGLNVNEKAQKDDEKSLHTPSFQMLDEEDDGIKEKLDAAKMHILDEGAENEAKLKRAQPTAFAIEMMRMKKGFVRAMLTLDSC